MSQQPKLKPEKIKIEDILIIKASLDCPLELQPNQIKGYNFELGFDMAFDLKEKIIKAGLEFSIKTESDDETAPVAQGLFEFAYLFEIENLEELTKLENNEVDVHPSLANAISSITYSTSRGILLTRFQGTAFRDFILPVLDPNYLLGKKMQK